MTRCIIAVTVLGNVLGLTDLRSWADGRDGVIISTSATNGSGATYRHHTLQEQPPPLNNICSSLIRCLYLCSFVGNICVIILRTVLWYWYRKGQKPCYGQATLHSPVVTVCTARLTFNNSTFCPHSVFMCFVWI